MADLFISYCRRNLERVTEVVRGFEASGLALWWDARLLPGEAYAQRIEQELDGAKCVVVAWSSDARNSIWVRAEASAALDAGKLVQARLDGASPPLPFNAAPLVDLTTWRGDRTAPPWPQLEDSVRGLAAGSLAPVTLDPLRGPALQGLETLAAIGFVSLALTALAGLATVLSVRHLLPLSLYGPMTMALFAGACVAAGFVVARFVQFFIASRTS